MHESAIQKNLNEPIVDHLRTDFARVSVDHTVGEALERIRVESPQGRILYFYVVDKEGRLQGVLPTRRLLLNPLDAKVADIMVRNVIAIPDSATVIEACEFFIMHRLLAFPIVDDEKRIIGIVDVELYTSELDDLEDRERADEAFQLVGVHLTDAQQESPVQAFRYRFPWLISNIVGGSAAAVLASFYEAEFKQAAALAIFMPLVLALSESVSMQSVSLAMQHLRGRRATWSFIGKKIRKEASVGLLLGGVCAVLVSLVVLFGWKNPFLTYCLIGGIAGGMIGAAVIGATVPMILRHFRRDPQVASGPVVLALSDIFTLLIYLSLARWLWAMG